MKLGDFIGKNKWFYMLLTLWAFVFVHINYQSFDQNQSSAFIFSVIPDTESNNFSEDVLINGNRTDCFIQRRSQPSPVRVERTQFFSASACSIFSQIFDYSFVAEIFSSKVRVIFASNYTFFCVKKRYLTFCTFRL